MNFDHDVLDIFYQNIINGFSPFVVDEAIYYAKHVTSSDLFDVNAHNLLVKKQLQLDGVASEYEIMKDLVAKGIWSPQGDIEIKTIEANIDKKRQLIDNLVIPSQKKQVEAEIKVLFQTLAEKQSIRYGLLTNSLEHKLQTEKREYIGFLCTYKTINERAWTNYDEFLELESSFCNNIVTYYFRAINDINNNIIRAIARTTDARYKLKVSSVLPSNSISTFLLELRQWCDFYNSIYELSDKPVEKVIQDDEKLDGWLAARKLKNKVQESVNNTEGYVGMMGATKEDMELLEGTDGNTVLKLAQKANG